MPGNLVITFNGPDRPGIVESLSRTVASFGGNWLESRMARLGGHFAGVARVSVASDSVEGLRNALSSLALPGFAVQASPEVAGGATPPAGRLASIEIVGQDRPGIVSQISGALARQGANVEDLSSWVESAPMSGEALFHCQVSLLLPDASDPATLRRELERIAADLMVDVAFVEAAP